jgi:excisionase family DNA binding protein
MLSDVIFMKTDNLPELLTIKQSSELLQCHPNTLRKWDRDGILVAVRIGPRGDRRYKKEDILAFIEQKS